LTVTDFHLVVTDRLQLSATDPACDVDGLFPIWSDPTSWEHAPDSRHAEPQQTLDWLERSTARWEADGLSYWTARLRETGAVVGAGGARRHVAGSWNLLWRISGEQQGKGLAAELGKAAIEAAHAVDDSVPVIAWIRSNNPASRRLAEKLGLVEHSERVDEEDGVVRIPYADREI
jgi:RimJ/RimL family protein N-acetyltransferase